MLANTWLLWEAKDMLSLDHIDGRIFSQDIGTFFTPDIGDHIRTSYN